MWRKNITEWHSNASSSIMDLSVVKQHFFWMIVMIVVSCEMYPDSSRWIQVSSNLHDAAESSQFLNKLVVCDLLFVLDYICHYWNVNFLFSPSLCSAKLISKYYTPWNTAPWFTLVVLAVTWICHLNLLSGIYCLTTLHPSSNDSNSHEE